jgi:hypothetical protein
MVGFIFEPERKILGTVLGRASPPKLGRPSVEGRDDDDFNVISISIDNHSTKNKHIAPKQTKQ